MAVIQTTITVEAEAAAPEVLAVILLEELQVVAVLVEFQILQVLLFTTEAAVAEVVTHTHPAER